MNSTHHVHRGPESLPCYCAANSDHLIGEEAMSPGEKLARLFHETYERLAPSFGYETRTETRQFDPTTPNGSLMIAVCAELSGRHGAGDAEDAARYRWLRTVTPYRFKKLQDACIADATDTTYFLGDKFDAAIDAARAGERG